MEEMKPYSYDEHTPEEWAEFITANKRLTYKALIR
jgi:hypothetical protein